MNASHVYRHFPHMITRKITTGIHTYVRVGMFTNVSSGLKVCAQPSHSPEAGLRSPPSPPVAKVLHIHLIRAFTFHACGEAVRVGSLRARFLPGRVLLFTSGRSTPTNAGKDTPSGNGVAHKHEENKTTPLCWRLEQRNVAHLR